MERVNVRLTALAGAAVLLLAGCTSGGTSTTPSPSATAPVTSTSTLPTGVDAPPSHVTVSPPTSASRSSSVVHQRLTGLKIADVTFVGTQGWLLGTATCLDGSGSACTAIEHSTDSGRTWTSMTAPADVHVVVPGSSPTSCPDTCLTGIRYATSTTGYLIGSGRYDPSGDGITFQTTDAGRHWVQQSGGADAIEAGDGTVLRAVDSGGCPPGCTYTVDRSPVGNLRSTSTIHLPGRQGDGDGVLFGRSGRHAYLLSLGHVAGGGDTATSVLWTSADDGSNWTNRGEPCAQRGSEYDSALLSVGPDGSAAVLCRQRSGQHQFIATTTAASGGAHFTAASLSALGAAQVTALGEVSGPTVVFSMDDTYRSTDGGNHNARLSANAGSSPGLLSWIGFSSALVGHAISRDRKTLWNTVDGGRTWSSATLR